MEGRVCLVSGGASGIGAAICEGLRAEGVAAVSLDLKPAEHAGSYQVDLCDPEAVAATIDQVRSDHGPIAGVVNNAGINDGVALGQPVSAFVESLQKNLVQCYGLVQAVLDDLKSQNGAIVNIGSKVYSTGQGGTSGYAAAKGGLMALTREWALDLAADQVRCNAVIPAEVWTEMYADYLSRHPDPEQRRAEIESTIPLGQRMTRVEEIAAMVCFLLSPVSAHTTGQIIHVDGGYTHLDRAYQPG